MTNPDGPHTGRVPTRAERGMVATPHVLASTTGLAVLRRGGSAVDALVAANAVLCVVYPHMAGLGGDAFALVATPDGTLRGLNASGPAAAGATREAYRSRGHTDAIPSRGPAAALTVPGAVDGWRELHEAHGRLAWSELFDDAARLADDGAPVARSLAQWAADDVRVLSQHEEAARVFLRPDGSAPREGERLRLPELAASLRVVAERGAREGFYEGELADRLCRGAGDASPLDPADFAAFRAEWVEPLTTTYRGLTVAELPPNTQGFAALQILQLLEGWDVAAWPDNGVEFLHHAAEAVKLAFADRNAWLTDPARLDIPLDRLLDKAYADRRRALVSDRALDMDTTEPGIPGPGSGPEQHGGDTVYLCAVDDAGLVVSLIQSVYHDFGSAVVPAGTGVLLQNRGSFFSLADDHPNALEPGKRTFHTLIPGMLLRDGRPWAAVGTMGGEGQPQTHAALVTRLHDRGYDAQQAVEAPRWLMGRTWGAESQDLWLEGRIADPVAHELERRGQPVKLLPDWDDNCGHASVIRVTEAGFLEGGADPRGDGAALGW